MKIRENICIICPISCDLVLTDNNNELNVSGNACKRGEIYAKSEYTNPVRMLTTTISLQDAIFPLLPVISSNMIPKNKLKDCFDLLYKVTVKAPIKEGDIIIPNILDTGVDIISAKSVSLIKK